MQLKVSEDMIVTTMRHIDEMHTFVVDCYWRVAGAHDSFLGEPPLAYFHTLREAMVVMKFNYLHLLTDRVHLLKLGEMY